MIHDERDPASLLRQYRAATIPRELPGGDRAAWRLLAARLDDMPRAGRAPATLFGALAAACVAVFLIAGSGSDHHAMDPAGHGGASGGEPGAGGARGSGGAPRT